MTTTPETSATSPDAPRRSGRARRKVASVYDEAARARELLLSASPPTAPAPGRGGRARGSASA